MYVITYSLRDSRNLSDIFYQELSTFTDEVLAEMDNLTRAAVDGYVSYLQKEKSLKIRSDEEHAFELLVLGTYWQVYSGDAEGLNEIPQQLLSDLAKLRRKGGSLKPGIDFIRGVMSTIFLSPDLYDNMYKLDVSLRHLEKLLDWLEATGEFSQEVVRLRRWEAYLKTLPGKEAEDVLATAITLAAWFESRSAEMLGKYTVNVDRYLNEIRPEHYWREDVIFCGRRRVEYHLNMVGAEIMNRAYRKAFNETTEKAVILPACMCLLPPSSCKARRDESGLHCVGCTAECSVNSIGKLGREHGFSVLVVSHESSISADKGNALFLSRNTGVVGVSCVLNLISGGWLLDGVGVPAQCVFLDYCGCKNHWSREGMPTEINMEQLKKILGIRA